MKDADSSIDLEQYVRSRAADEIYKKQIGARIKAVARKLGGQSRLCTITDISEAQLRRYIKGASEPTVLKLLDISRAGEVSLDWLVTGEGRGGGLIAEDTYDEYLLETSESFNEKFNQVATDLEQICDQVGFHPSDQIKETLKNVMFSGQLSAGGALTLIQALKVDKEQISL